MSREQLLIIETSNASISSTSPNSPPRMSSSITLSPRSPSISRSNSVKIDQLVEYTYIPLEAQINATELPFLNPYELLHKNNYLQKSIKKLITPKKFPIKEYIQSSQMNNCLISATKVEQFVDFEVPQDLIDTWKREWYTHLHFGVLRLVLSLHGR